MEAVPRETTIRDVARAAGVGVGTISRVLNASSQVSPATRARVLKAIRRMGFRPNAQARRILKRRSETVCFLLSNRAFLHPFHARILQGVESCASGLKQHILFAALHYSARTAADKIDLPHVLQEKGLIDGVILAGTVYSNLLQRLEELRIPLVAFSNNVVGVEGVHRFDQVGFDDANGMREATRYLVGEGHREIVFVGDTSLPWLQRRFAGYREAMRDKRLKSALVMAGAAKSFVEFGQRAAEKLLARKERPTAIVAGNDETAYGVWLSLRRHGVRVPEEISLVGFDDREEAMLMDPPLTTVRVHKEEIGQACMKMLLERLHNPKMAYSHRVLPTEFIVRGTVGRLKK